MKNAIPPGFEMACFPVPMIEGVRATPVPFTAGRENFFVPADAKHLREALDFLEVSGKPGVGAHLHPAARYAIAGARFGEGPDHRPGAAERRGRIDNSSRIFSDRLNVLYLTFAKSALPDALAALCREDHPGGVRQRLEGAMEQVRRNPDIYKPPAMGVP